MTKKILSVFIAILMIMAIAPPSVFAEGDNILDYLTYEIVDGKVTITGCDQSVSGNIVIPETIEEYPVTKIGSLAFSNRFHITSIILPDSLTHIGYGAFMSCQGLVNINIPDNVEHIESMAFYHCISISDISIPDKVRYLGSQAIGSCLSLESITIGSGLKTLVQNAIIFCPALTKITVDEANTEYSSDKYGVLFNKDKTELIRYPEGNTGTEYTIPGSVIKVGAAAFENCENLVNIQIPDSVTTIGDTAFYGCTDIKDIIFPDSLTSIGENAFDNCDSLTSVILPDSVTSVGSMAFNDCNSLASVTLSKNLTEIADGVFGSCDNLTDITIPYGVETIGESAFIACSNLTKVTIPDSVTAIETGAFFSCENLKSITIPESVQSIGSYALGYYKIRTGSANPIFEYRTYEDFVIYGYIDSAAEIYANENNIQFIPLCDNHANTVIKNKIEATPDTDGYTGDLFCAICGELLEQGEVIPATGNQDENKKSSFFDRLKEFIMMIINFFKNLFGMI